MIFGKALSYVGATFFLIYGVGFALFPNEMAELVTDTVPLSSSAVIDMRSTYGGMSLAVGIFMVYLARRDVTVWMSVSGFMVLMLAMASTRLIGIVLDGSANMVMYLYLLLEILSSVLCGVWLYVFKTGDSP